MRKFEALNHTMAASGTNITFDALRRQLANGQYAPVYLLHGEEGFYIDEILADFERIIPAEDKEFNQYTLYAPQVEPGRVMDICMGVPMMADRQLVILKEAQSIKSDQLNRLHRYVSSPSPSTILVICVRGATTKAKDLLAAVKAKGVVFESKKGMPWELPKQVEQLVAARGMRAGQKAIGMLCDFIGADLSRVNNEIVKLAGLLGRGAEITPEAIERNIGYSKDFNSFELVDAVAAGDMAKSIRIANYFASNTRNGQLYTVASSLFSLFADLITAVYTKDKSDENLMQVLGIKKLALRRLRVAMQRYNAFQVIEIMDAIRRFDAMSKGIGSRRPASELLQELLYHIFTAPGKLPY
ncbi:MAG: DNA polymerase III subunit delta [Muribaculaceae bacterium]|nr:DNA polymerase III subunit delta [Muribaculaceae bacterium]